MTRTRTGIVALLALCCGCEGDTPTAVPVATPARVEDLRVDQPVDTTLRLLWTSPPVEAPHPPPVRYEIRYAMAPLTDAAAIAAAAAVFAPAGKPAGETEIVVIGGLDRSRQYELVVRGAGTAGGWSEWSNVARAATENAPPVAVIQIPFGTGLAGGETVLDGTRSSDFEDGNALEYRWDVGNDGTWDSDWSRAPTLSHVFPDAGTASVALQVRDSGGATADAAQSFPVLRVRYRSQSNLVLTQVRSPCCYTFPHCTACDSTRAQAAKGPGPFTGDVGITIPTGLTAAGQRFAPTQTEINLRISGYASGSADANFLSKTGTHVEFEIATGYTFDFQAVRDAIPGARLTWQVALRSGEGTVFDITDVCCDGGSYAESGTLAPGVYSFDWTSEMTHGSFGTVLVLRLGALPAARAEVRR